MKYSDCQDKGSVTVLASDGHGLVPNYLRVSYLRNPKNWTLWNIMTHSPRRQHPRSTVSITFSDDQGTLLLVIKCVMKLLIRSQTSTVQWEWVCNGCNCWSMLGLKLNYVSKRDLCWRDISSYVVYLLISEYPGLSTITVKSMASMYLSWILDGWHMTFLLIQIMAVRLNSYDTSDISTESISFPTWLRCFPSFDQWLLWSCVIHVMDNTINLKK